VLATDCNIPALRTGKRQLYFIQNRIKRKYFISKELDKQLLVMTPDFPRNERQSLYFEKRKLVFSSEIQFQKISGYCALII